LGKYSVIKATKLQYLTEARPLIAVDTSLGLPGARAGRVEGFLIREAPAAVQSVTAMLRACSAAKRKNKPR
jgi:hypothetical protein